MSKRIFYVLITIIFVVAVMCAQKIIFFLSVGDVYQSAHFRIENSSDASNWELRNLAQALEKGRVQVCSFLHINPTFDTTLVSVREGFKIPTARDGKLQMYRYHNKINQSAIVHELVHIISKNISLPAIDEGLAVFVSESIHQDHLNRFPNYNQNADAWVKLFLQRTSLISLKQLLEIQEFHFNVNGSPEDAYSWQGYLEGASFVHWVVQAKGWDVFWRYYHSTKPVPLLGPSIEEIEQEWVTFLKGQQLPAFSCREQLDLSQARFQFWCNAIEKGVD